MKKFLALLVALSVFAFAGSAFATSGTADQPSVTVTAGESTTVTVTGTKTHGGDLSYSVTGDVTATVKPATGSSTTVTISPAATVVAGQHTVTVTVTESYSVYDPSATGHTRPVTDTGTVDITVNVNSPVSPLSITAVEPSATEIVAGETVSFRLSYTGGNGTPTFSLDGVTFSGTTATFTPKAAGTYTLVFTAVDELGLGAQAQTVTITVYDVLSAIAVLAKPVISADEPVTITLTATGGIGETTFSSSTAGVELDSPSNPTRATFSSTESGIFPLEFTAADKAGHTVKVKVSVIVDASAPETEAEDVTERVESHDVQETLTAIALLLSDDLKNIVDTAAISSIMTQSASVAVLSNDSYTDGEKELAKNTDENNKATVISLKSTGVFPSDAEDVNPWEITITPTTDIDNKTAENDANNGTGSSAAVTGFNVTVTTKSGVVSMPLSRFNEKLYGLLLRLYKTITGGNNNGALPGFMAAADDDATNTTVFLDSNGNVTTTVPTSLDVHGNPRIAGYVTMVTYLEAGKNYDMIISVPAEELETAGVSTTTQSVDVIMPRFSASRTNYFSTFVSSDIITGTDFYRIGENVLTSKLNNLVVKNDWARTPEELALATANNYTMITRLASIDATAEEATHTYIVAAVFSADQAKRDRIDTTEDGGFIFYPNGPAEAAANVEVLKLVTRDNGTYGFDDLTPADIRNGVTNGYLAFSVAGGSALTKPMLAVRLVPASTVFAFALSVSGITVQQGKTETVTVTPVNNSGDVSYTAYEGTTALDWFSYSNGADSDVLTFAPTASVTTGSHTVTIMGVDEALKVYSTDITVTVTAASGSDVTPALTLTSSKSSLSLVLGNTETLRLTSNALGTATYAVTADEDAGVELDTATGEASIEPTAAGTYSLVFSVIDSGRASDSNTASITVPLVVTAGGRVGSSGGGCDAGFGVLALAVLGGLIAARKK